MSPQDRPLIVPATSRPSLRAWARAMCCSSTKSIASVATSKKCCTPRWKISNSTSCWGRGRRHVRFASTCRASPLLVQRRELVSSLVHCATALVSLLDSITTTPTNCSPSFLVPQEFSASESMKAAHQKSRGVLVERPVSPTDSFVVSAISLKCAATAASIKPPRMKVSPCSASTTLVSTRSTAPFSRTCVRSSVADQLVSAHSPSVLAKPKKRSKTSTNRFSFSRAC